MRARQLKKDLRSAARCLLTEMLALIRSRCPGITRGDALFIAYVVDFKSFEKRGRSMSGMDWRRGRAHPEPVEPMVRRGRGLQLTQASRRKP